MEDGQTKWRDCRWFMVFWTLLLRATSTSACSRSESRALLSLKGNSSSDVFLSWVPGSDCCNRWDGVLCDPGTGDVLSLNLTGMFVSGAVVSPELCALNRVRTLSITFASDMAGEIPSCFWNMSALEDLDLGGSGLSGTISSQLCNLRNLRVLSLGMNGLVGQLPPCIWDMSALEYMDLSGNAGIDVTGVGGPPLGGRNATALSRLQHLDISELQISVGLPQWIGNLSQLRFLDFSFNNITDLPNWIGNLSNLESLSLSFNNIPALPKTIGSWDRLVTLRAGTNLLNVLPEWIGTLRLLEELDISSNFISGALPDWFGNLSRLHFLDISSNAITALPASPSTTFPLPLETLYAYDNRIAEVPSWIGWLGGNIREIKMGQNVIEEIPFSFGNLSALQVLWLGSNRLKSLPSSIGNLSSLGTLVLRDNLIGELPTSFARLSSLGWLDLYNNNLSSFNIGRANSFPFMINLDLGNNRLTNLSMISVSAFPNLFSLEVQGNLLRGEILEEFSQMYTLAYLDLSENFLTGRIPEALGYLSWFQLRTIKVAGNRLTGPLPATLYNESSKLFWLNCSNNNLSGPLGEFRWGAVDVWVDLSKNHFSGRLPPFAKSTFAILQLAENDFSGEIPMGLAGSPSLEVLDLSSNLLSGPVPEIFDGLTRLSVLNLASNKLVGSLPRSLENCSRLQRLHAANNSFTGRIPGVLSRSLVSLSLHSNSIEGEILPLMGTLTDLVVLDLGYNKLNGTLPSSFRNLSACLRVLMVRGNRLSGHIPSWIVDLQALQLLDLSHNFYAGPMPTSYSGLQGFIMSIGGGSGAPSNRGTLYDDQVQISAKGAEMVLTNIIAVRTSFDVSHNHLNGTLPGTLAELRALRYLTLGSNNFSGSIPAEFSNLLDLESLDLSCNDLSGSIPQVLNRMASLAYFNVSHNQLTGMIPPGPGQLSTFPSSSFEDNLGLCGIPLPDCSSPPTPSPYGGERRHGSNIGDWISPVAFFVSFGVGFGLSSAIFVVSKRARACLCIPSALRLPRFAYHYRKVYGAYVPKD